jgi:hypothetical protein
MPRPQRTNHPPGTKRISQEPAAWPLRPALAMLALAAIVIGWPWLSGRVTIPWDAKAHFLPQIQFLAHSLARGESPFWAPYVFSGQPQIADPQSMIFSPPFLLLALLNPAPSVWAADATLLAMVFLGGAALMLWFRDQGWHWAGALIAALAFCYGAAMAWRIQHVGQVLSLTYLPITMLCLDRALRRKSIVYGAAAGVAAALIVLGRDQVALLSLYLLAGFAAWRILATDRPVETARANLLPLAAGAASALIVFAVPVLLTVLFAAESNRPEIDFIGAGRGSLHPALLLTLVAPDVFGAAGRMEDYWGPPSFAWPDTGLFIAQNVGQLYIGAIPLLLIVLAGLRGELWARDIRFFTVAALLMLLYALGWYTPAFQVFYTLLPGISLYRRPADAVFLVGALGAILAGYAVHRLFTDTKANVPRQQVQMVAGVIGSAFLLLILLAVWRDRLPLLPFPLGISVLTFAAAGLLLYWVRLGITVQPTLAAILLGAFTTLDLAYHNGPMLASALPPSTYAVLEPPTNNATIAILKSRVVDDDKRRDRIELTGLGFHWPNASLTHSLENTLGYNPLRLRLYSEATGAEDHVGLPDQRKFSPLFPSYRSKLAALLGLRFIAAGAPIDTIDRKLKPGDLPLVARTSDGFIYENPNTYDRVLFATAAQTANFDRLLQDGQWPDVDLKTTVLLEEAPPARATPAQPGQARIVSYRNTRIELEADSPDGGWVVLNDVWQPWWFAEVDGSPAEILRANVLFRAVAVPPGRHKVTFTFRPLAGALNQLRSPVPRHAP